MKTVVSILFLAWCNFCFAGGETNIIAVSDWSQPVEYDAIHYSGLVIRGRLLIEESNQPATGWRTSTNSARMFLELQNVSFGKDVKFFVDICDGLKCELVLTDGTSIKLDSSGGWGGRGGRSPYWVLLPVNATIRLFIADGPATPLVIHPNGFPSPRWSIPSSDTNVYYLSGTLNVSTPTNGTLIVTPPDGDYYRDWEGTLTFPRMRISVPKP